MPDINKIGPSPVGNVSKVGPSPVGNISTINTGTWAQGGGGDLNKDYSLALSYNIIKGFTPAQKCIKRYLTTQLQTGLYGISGEDWSYAAALPLQKFVGPQPW